MYQRLLGALKIRTLWTTDNQ